MSIEIVLSLFTALGLGSILGAFFQSKFQQKVELLNQEKELKRKRYSAIIIQMLTILDFDKNIKFVKTLDLI